MVIVGEAIVRLRVISDRLASDIRKAVKESLDGVSNDLDKQGEKAGDGFGDGVTKGIRKSRTKISKEIELTARRFTADAGGAIEDAGDRIGRRFTSSFGDGINDSSSWDAISRMSAQNFSKALGTNLDDELKRIGNLATKSLGDGINDDGQWNKIRQLTAGRVMQAIGGNNGAIVKAGRDSGSRFAGAIGDGMADLGPDIQADVRRVFRMRPGDLDDDGETAAHSFADGIDKGFKSRFARFRQTMDDFAQNMASRLGSNYRKFSDFGSRASDNIGDGLRRGTSKLRSTVDDTVKNMGERLGSNFRSFRDFGSRAAGNLGDGFQRSKAFTSAIRTSMVNAAQNIRSHIPGFGRAGEDAGDAAGNGIRNGINRHRTNIGKLFDDIGRDFGKHFNLGIGAARMGPAIVSLIALAAPSVLSGAAALGTSLGAMLVARIAAAVPALVGGLGLAAAAAGTLLLNFKLLSAAFKNGGEQLNGLKGTLTEVTKTINQTVAAGFLTDFTNAANTLRDRILPGIIDLLGKTGAAFGRIGNNIAETVARSDNMGRIQGILQTNIGFLDNFNTGVSGLTTGLIILLNAAKPFVDFLGSVIGQFGEWAGATLAAKEANGELASFMTTVLDRFRAAAGAIANVAVGLYNVGKAAEPFGRSMDNITQKFRDWTGSEEGQSKMTAFFEKAHTLAGGLANMFDGIGRAFGNAFLNMDTGPILQIMDIIGNKLAPALAQLWNQVQSGAGDNLVRIFDNIAISVQKIADSGNFEKIANFIGTLLEKISELAASDIGSTILSFIIPFALFGGMITSLIGPLFSLGTAIAGLSAPVLAVGAVIALAVGAFAAIYANSEKFRESISGLVSALSGTFMEIWGYIQPKVEELWNSFTRLAGVIGDRLAPIIEALTPVLQAIFTTIGEYVGDAISVITAFFTFLADLFSGNWTGLWDSFVNIFITAWNLLTNLIGNIGGIIGSIFSGIGGLLLGIWNSIWATLEEPVTTFVNWIISAWNSIWAAAESIFSAIGEFFSGIWDGIVSGVTSAWNGVTSFLSGIWNGILTVVSFIWNNILMTIVGVVAKIIEGILKFGNLILQIVLAPFRLAWLAIQAVWAVIFIFLQGIWMQIVEVATELWGVLTEFFTGIWEGISEAATAAWNVVSEFLRGVWEGISETATSIWTTIVEFFSGIWDGISATATEVWTTITEFLRGVWEGISATVTEAWTAITTFFSTIWESIKILFTAALDIISAYLSQQWENIKTVASTVWDAITAYFSQLWERIKLVFTAALEVIVAFLSERWENIKANVSMVWEAISAFFQGIWDRISQIFHSVVDPVVQWLSERWQEISDTASEIWNSITEIASSAWQAVVDAVHTVVDPIVQWLQDRWDDITSAVSTAFDAVAAPVSAAWEAIKSSIVDPIADAYADLTGWIDSIKQLIQGAWDTVSGIISDINAAISTAADKVAEASTLGVGGQAGVVTGGSASGGIIRPTPGGQVRRLAEVGKAERVEPLDSKGLSDRDYAMIQRLGLLGGGTAGGTPVVHVYIGQTELTQIVDTRVEYSNTTVARDALNGRRT